MMRAILRSFLAITRRKQECGKNMLIRLSNDDLWQILRLLPWPAIISLRCVHRRFDHLTHVPSVFINSAVYIPASLQHLDYLLNLHTPHLATQTPTAASGSVPCFFLPKAQLYPISVDQHRRLLSQLRSADLSRCQLIKREKLHSLLRLCSSLTALNLRGCHRWAADLESGVGAFVDLRLVPCLLSLDISDNQLGPLQIIAGIMTLAEKNLGWGASLTSLNLAENRLWRGQMEGVCAGTIAKKLRSVPSLTFLNLSYNSIGEGGTDRLARNLRWVPSLISLDLTENHIRDLGAITLAENLRSVPSLTYLNLSFNLFGDPGLDALAENLRSVPSLTCLDLARNRFRDHTGRLAENLRWVPSLTSLSVARNYISDASICALARHLRWVPSLKSLSVGYNEFGNEGARILAQNLRSVPSLTFLDIPRGQAESYNWCGVAWMGCWKTNRSITNEPTTRENKRERERTNTNKKTQGKETKQGRQKVKTE